MSNNVFIDRVWLWSATWGLVVVMVAVSMFDGVSAFDIPVLLYALTAIGTEFRGVRLSRESVGFPWRPIPGLPFLTFWRRRLPLRTVESIVELRPSFGLARLRLKLTSGVGTSLLFSGKREQSAFLDAAMTDNASLSVFRMQ